VRADLAQDHDFQGSQAPPHTGAPIGPSDFMRKASCATLGVQHPRL
jgi:hypothetical protein